MSALIFVVIVLACGLTGGVLAGHLARRGMVTASWTVMLAASAVSGLLTRWLT